jgi:glycosyltransferase involved in cell wall biosynthesis
MIHVVLVTTSYPDSQSGSEAAGGFVADFAEQLSKHVRVTVVAVAAGASSVQTEGSLRVHRFAVRRWPLSLLRPHHPADWWAIYSTLRDGRKVLRDVVDADRPDYILALWALPSGYWARSVLRRYGVPYGVWALGSDIWALGRIPLLRRYLRMVLRGADRRYADGLRLAEEVAKLCGAPCDFMPSARHLPRDKRTDIAGASPYRLAFLGRWHRNKGVDILLESLHRLSDEDWTRISEVRIHGGGPLEEDVRNAVRQLQALDRPISVGGYLDTVGAVELIGWTDYLALPSRVESIPVIFSDAAQMGRPLIATPVGDLPELFHMREFGVLASDVTVAAFADALRHALRTPASQFQPQLDEFAREFDIADVAKQFASYVEEISL